ncbi:MAG: hypothetical protein KF729_23480 [Sandaracinaceae bacterium]|nr:hypothetical protein [Sandaracinaceae bacterium]
MRAMIPSARLAPRGAPHAVGASAWCAVVLGAFVVLCPRSAQAFAIGSTVSEACHERITLDALEAAPPFDLTPVDVPDAAWWRLAGHYARTLDAAREPTSGAARLVLTTAVLGVRSPDLGELGLVHIHNLREIHLLDERQVNHFLRRNDQDGDEGGAAAIADGRAHILALIEASARAYDADPRARLLSEITVYVERYGQVGIDVWRPLFLLAQALHALQDSFTHTYRSDDARRILVIQNYVEAVTPRHDEARDGPRHSDTLDDCRLPEVAPLAAAATQASTELVGAVQRYWLDRDLAPVEAALDRWTSVDPDCGAASDYCGSRWPALARTAETGPLLGCAAASGGRSPRAPFAALSLACSALAARRRLASRGGRARAVVSIVG